MLLNTFQQDPFKLIEGCAVDRGNSFKGQKSLSRNLKGIRKGPGDMCRKEET